MFVHQRVNTNIYHPNFSMGLYQLASKPLKDGFIQFGIGIHLLIVSD